MQDMVQRVLDMATEETDNPDLRDRGFIYWRLLSTDPEAAKMVVLGDKPVIEDDTFRLDPALLNVLIEQIATLSSVYHKPPDAFVVRRGAGMEREGKEDNSDDEDEYGNRGDGEVDLLDMGGMSVNDKSSSAGGKAELVAPLVRVCGPEKSGGIEIFAGFVQKRKKIFMEMELRNESSPSDISTLAIQLNKNSFGLAPTNQQIVCNPPIQQGSTGVTEVELASNPNMLVPVAAGQPASPQIQVAVKNMTTGSVFYFAVNIDFECLFAADGQMERSAFIESWKSIDDRNELYGTISDLPRDSVDIESVQAKFKNYNIFFIARRPVPNAEGQEVVYFSMRTVTDQDFLAELTFKAGFNACKLCLKTDYASYGLLAKTAIERILREG
jgi:AP-1 complex subunit beta-1